MGKILSLPYVAFEILNEIYVAVAGGILGVFVLASHGLQTNKVVGTVTLSAITLASLVYVFRTDHFATPSCNKVVFVTGCDSGLGFSLAQHACEMGFTVLAGCLDLNSEGSVELRRLFTRRVYHIEVDVTRGTSIEVAVEVIEDLLQNHPAWKLWAIVNNAGVMVFGEFEWLTDSLIENQINVNLAGTFRVTKAFCPLLRYYKGRIITVSSHCALATLPGLAVYGATKAGLLAWGDGIRVELKKYGVEVITFIPGSFIQQSNIMAKQVENCYEMHAAFSTEQKRFYGDYFKRYNSYLSMLGGSKSTKKIDDPGLYKEFEAALLQIPPKSIYVNQPFKYGLYHMLFKYSPVMIRDYLIVKFMKMPEYSSSFTSCTDVLG